ncbi:hypothetical protein IMSHALPRED_002824 [Imshaugia aleurites]|uniref:Uncharacterized protein n=1 Tax=Imshaugia aleurites TaxID=172621 RepID=A0A8H3J6P5_9LECA|nr:hypothetical protein IMSHALPRED_002824 [Imshaugia aleurites]
MDSRSILDQQLERLREHTEPPTSQPRAHIHDYSIEHEHAVRELLGRWNVSTPLVSESISAAVKCQIVRHRRVRTTTSRVVEMEVREVIGNHPLPAVVIRMLFDKLHQFFSCVQRRRPELLPSGLDTTHIRDLCLSANQRQHFHTIRSLLGPFRLLLRYLSKSDQGSERSLLEELGELGVIVPSEVNKFVASAAFGDTDEILSPPEHLRKVWKPVGRERAAPEDGGQLGEFTKQLWRTHCRVRDCCAPPVSDFELKALFGVDATLISHAHERLPYECGAYKYTLAGQDPFVVDCTNKGLFTTSGPSGTAYRYSNLWLVLGGPREKLPELRLAMAALLLGGVHHSLVEVIAVCAPIMGDRMPQGLEEMLRQLVPHGLELKWRGVSQSITPEAFHSELGGRLEDRLL